VREPSALHPGSVDSFNVLAIVVSLAAVFSYLNHRHFKLPPTVALMIMSLVLSLALVVLARASPWGDMVDREVRGWLEKLRFSRTLLGGMLGFLLFAGALRINLEALMDHLLPIAVLALLATAVSTVLVGAASRLLVELLPFSLPFAYCLVFGALISPTDPITVLNLFRRRKVPRNLETTMAGESLLNDGIAVVLFAVLLELARMGDSGKTISAPQVLLLFAREAGGGVALGLLLGFAVFQLMKRVDNYPLEILMTLSLVMGGYALAQALHSSGPLAMVVAGIIIGNQGKSRAMSETSRKNLETFWELVEEFLDAVLFVLVGLEALLISFNVSVLVFALVLVPVILLIRLLAAGVPITLLRRRYGLPRRTGFFITWAGLKGGISIALALSLTPGPPRRVIVLITYVIVVFTIVVQGLTVEPALRLLRIGQPPDS
jgi:CPA1 family monovalent cation:H+ antiporter